jgi:hypothetical protein
MMLCKWVYVKLQIIDRSFLANVGFVVDITIQTFLQSCRSANDIEYVAFEALDFSSMQMHVLGFTFDAMLLDFLKSHTAKCSATDVALSPSGDCSHSNSGGSCIYSDRKKVVVSVKNMSQCSAFEMGPGEKYSNFTVHRAHYPHFAGDK